MVLGRPKTPAIVHVGGIGKMKNPGRFFPPARPFDRLPDEIGIFDRAGSKGVFLRDTLRR